MHAPGTLLADQFGGDWEAYLTAIEQSDPLILALGVTDYFCIQTYKEVRKRKAAGRPAHGPEIWCQFGVKDRLEGRFFRFFRFLTLYPSIT